MLKKLLFTLFVLLSAFNASTKTIDAQACSAASNNCPTGTYCNVYAGQCLPQIIDDGVTNETFDSVNPLKISTSTTDELREQFSTPGGIVSRILMFAFPISGMILFIMIVWGGFEILAGASNKKSLDAGKQRVTGAIAGFMLLFASYWIAQIVEVIFGIVIV